MASKAKREAAIKKAAHQVRHGSPFLRRAGDPPQPASTEIDWQRQTEFLRERVTAMEGLLLEREVDNQRLRAVLELIAAGPRPDGTYNRSREACRELAGEALEDG